MSLHSKWERLMSLQPDIAVIPECAHPDRIAQKLKAPLPASYIWTGDNPNKGLGVFAFGKYQVETSVEATAQKLFLPARVCGPLSFNMLGVWAFNHRARGVEKPVSAPTRQAFSDLKSFIQERPTIVAGDFNHSVQWDRPGWEGNFEAIATALADLGLVSAYHAHRGAAFGQEVEKTHFFRKGPAEYHIDYCFLPKNWALTDVEVGIRGMWLDHSDHAPLVTVCDVAV